MPKLISCSNREEKQNLMEYLRTGQYPTGYTKEQKRLLRQKAEHFTLLGDDLCYRGRERLMKVVFEYESDLIKHIIETEHSIAHIGVNKMLALIGQKYYGIPKACISGYVKACEACSRFNSLRTIQPVYINDITKKYDLFMMDCVDLRRYADENDQYCWILNVIDTYTKHLWSFKMTQKTSQSVRDSLKHLFDNFGVPLAIQSDNGREFKNAILERFLGDLNIQVIHGRPRNPKAQGQVERVNQTVKRWLAKKLHLAGGKRWIDHLNDVVYAYNRTVHSATNKSPFMLFFGQPGFNNPLSGGIAVETENGMLIPSADASQDQITEHRISDSDVQWDLEIGAEVHSDQDLQDTSVQTQRFTPENSDAENEVALQVAKHFQLYKERIIESKDSNSQCISVSIGSKVLIKKDFDMNPRTRRAPFDSFYDDTVFTVSAILSNNMVEIKNNSGETKAVYKGVIKLI